MKINHVIKAQKDILTSTGKQKISNGQPLAEEDYIVKRGESYYWWQFAYCKKSISKTPPTKYQLTRNAHTLFCYEIEDRVDALEANDSLQENVESIVSDLQSQIDEYQERFDNIPEQLQEGSAGSLINERIENLQEIVDALEGIDFDVDFNELANEAFDELEYDFRDKLKEKDVEEKEDKDEEDVEETDYDKEVDSLLESFKSDNIDKVIEYITACKEDQSKIIEQIKKTEMFTEWCDKYDEMLTEKYNELLDEVNEAMGNLNY